MSKYLMMMMMMMTMMMMMIYISHQEIASPNVMWCTIAPVLNLKQQHDHQPNEDKVTLGCREWDRLHT